MKILYLCSWYREDPSSSEGVFFAEQAAVFAKHGHEVAIAHCRKTTVRQLRSYSPFKVSQNEEYTPSAKGTVYRGEVVWPPSKFQNNPFFFRELQYSHFLKKVFKDFGRPDVIHIQSALDAGVLSYKYLMKKGIPYVLTEHSSRFLRNVILPYQQKSLPGLCSGAAKNYCVSKSLRETLLEYGVTAPVSILSNIVDGKIFNTSGNRRDRAFTFLIACNFKKNKRIDLAMKAFDRLSIAYPNAHLKIAGSGKEEGELKSLANNFNCSQKIFFLGRLSALELAAEMNRSHCLLSVSEHETFGLTIIEAMACGMYVISTRSGGPDDIVKLPYGKLISIDDADELHRAMVDAIETVEYSDSKSESRSSYAINQYGADSFYQALVQGYCKASDMGDGR